MFDIHCMSLWQGCHLKCQWRILTYIGNPPFNFFSMAIRHCFFDATKNGNKVLNLRQEVFNRWRINANTAVASNRDFDRPCQFLSLQPTSGHLVLGS